MHVLLVEEQYIVWLDGVIVIEQSGEGDWLEERQINVRSKTRLVDILMMVIYPI